MKTKIISYLAASLISITSLFTVKAHADVSPDTFEEVKADSQDPYDKRLLLGKKIALEKLQAFMKNPISHYSTDAEIKETLDMMYSGLKSAKILKVKPAFAYRTVCREGNNVDFYVPTKGEIAIVSCFRASEYNVDQLAESFDHESYHIYERLKGFAYDPSNRKDVVESEAFALEYEFAIIRNSNKDKCIYVGTSLVSEPDIKSALDENNVGIPPLCKSTSDSNYGIASR